MKKIAFIIVIGIALAVIPFQVQSPQIDKQEKWESFEEIKSK